MTWNNAMGIHSPSSHSLQKKAEQISNTLPALMIQAQRIAASMQQGIHGRLQKGMSETFWEFREYRPEDNAQSIDWRRSARSDTLYIRENEWEASQNIWFWIDQRKGMHWHSSRAYPTKRNRAVLIVLVLSILLIKGGERIGLMGETALRHGQAGWRKFIHDLEKSTQKLHH